jgi:hypothetical protein
MIAYLILVHANPRQFARLVAGLPAASPLFVHIDRRASPEMADALMAVCRGRARSHFVERHACYWGGIGIARATVSLMQAAIASGEPFDHATLLSGADYPIKSDAAIAARLGVDPQAEHIEAFSMREPNRWSKDGGLFAAPSRMLRPHLRLRSRVWRLPWSRRLPYGLEPYGGGQWWTLTRAAVAHMVGYLDTHPRLMRFMRGTFIPDEALVQTLLANSPFAANITGSALRLQLWDRPEPPYPATLKAGDIDLIAASPDLFARKLDPNMDEAVYDRIDRALR